MPQLFPFYYLCLTNPHKIMELLRYFYHPDHASTWLSTSLGSSASTELSNLWITDNTGRPIQHLHYLPFGEDWVDQRNSSWNAPYTFSGKEKDVETGYGYFGARYYDSGLSIWLSVDPMSDKYPSMSPYNYCANNPVKLIDPDGMEIFDTEGGPDDPMGKGNGPAPNQTKNKPAPLTFPTSNNLPNKQNKTSQSSSTPAKTPKFKFNFNINLDGGGGVHFYNNSDRDRPGPDRKTNHDVNMEDISNFPTGTGATNGSVILENLKFGFETIEQGLKINDKYKEYKQKMENEKNENYLNDTILLKDPCTNGPHWLNPKLKVARKDSAETMQKLIEDCK